MSEFKCPKNLAIFLMAVGKKLSGDQLRECIEQARDEARWTTPSLNTAETGVAQWIMADDGMAEQYVAEHRKGLQAMEERRRALGYALEHLVGDRGDWNVEKYLGYIVSNAKNALDYIESARKELKREP